MFGHPVETTPSAIAETNPSRCWKGAPRLLFFANLLCPNILEKRLHGV